VIGIEITRNIQIFFPSAPKAEQGPYAARILYEDSKRDLAILRVNVVLPALRLAQSYAFRRGDDVTIIGNPGLGGHVTLPNAVAKGVMSTETTLEGQRFYQLGASINPGNSGGSVIGSDSTVIGVATAKAANAEALGFCIPVEDLNSALTILDSRAPQEIARVETAHNARAVYLRILVSGVLYRTELDTYVSAIAKAIELGGTDDDWVRAVYKECTNKASIVGENLDRYVRPELTALANDVTVPESIKRDLMELWATCHEMKTYIDQPTGSYLSYRDKVVELWNRFDGFADRLKIATGAVE